MTRLTQLLSALALLVALACATAPALTAQTDYEPALAAHLASLEADGSPDNLAAVGAALERIAAAHPDAWLPAYYAALAQQRRHYAAGEAGCAPCLEAMDAHLVRAEAADDNAEVMTLRASYYQSMLSLHPMRAPYYGPKAGTLLQQAMRKDPSNPRAASLYGQNLYYTPAMFGGGVAKAQPHLARAVELFAAEADAERGVLPAWGARRAAAVNAQALAKL